MTQRTCDKIRVTGVNKLKVRPGGFYHMELGCREEQLIAKIHMLAVFCNLEAEDISESGESLSVIGQEIAVVAEKLYEVYRPAIESGHNVFEWDRYWDKRNAKRYVGRPIINQYCNASKSEATKGLPEGWWYNYLGYAEKMFEDYFIVVGNGNGYPEVSILNPRIPEVLECILIGDYSPYYVTVNCATDINVLDKVLPPELVTEVKTVVDFINYEL